MIDAAEHYSKRMAEFRGERPAPGGIAFVGSSHVELFPLGELLPEWRFVNRGITSDRIGFSERGILRRLEVSIVDLQPCLILLENGANDLGELWRNGTPLFDEIAEGYRLMLGTVRSLRPEVPLCVTGVMPACGRFAGLVPLLARFNEVTREAAACVGAEFIDMYPRLVDAGGLLCENLTEDGLHLNRTGYGLWAEALRSYLGGLRLPPSAFR